MAAERPPIHFWKWEGEPVMVCAARQSKAERWAQRQPDRLQFEHTWIPGNGILAVEDPRCFWCMKKLDPTDDDPYFDDEVID